VHDGNMMWGWGGMFFGPLMMLVVLAVVVILVVMLFRLIGGAGSTLRGTEQRSLQLLKERFARGEIDSKEYEERRRILLD